MTKATASSQRAVQRMILDRRVTQDQRTIQRSILDRRRTAPAKKG